ncbi:TetR/AcrR family transcriptional regulator [Kitasatospora sp. NPDC056138]|uniref:TetR/AcrR family transcriptional regulator n=1 Tax=Kitasatospora sp. NPDC056138 TaxID=3345724 RepID=UPI0035D77260
MSTRPSPAQPDGDDDHDQDDGQPFQPGRTTYRRGADNPNGSTTSLRADVLAALGVLGVLKVATAAWRNIRCVTFVLQRRGVPVPKHVDHAQRRSEISAAVWLVVSDSGLEGLTLRAVAAAANCTTGLVTHYFRDKKALLAHVRSDMHRRMAERIDAMPTRDTARETLYAVAEQALPLDEERRLEATVWSHFQLAARTDRELLHEHTVSHASWTRRLTELVSAALPTPLKPSNLQSRVLALVACLDGLALNAVTDPDAYPPDLQRRVLRTQLDLILERHRSL